jgi:hypothetical protein
MKMLQLTKGYSAIVDDSIFDKVLPYNWQAYVGCWGVYARRYRRLSDAPGSFSISLHNVILPPTDGLLVDHINGNSLDNRASNLRLVTVSQNTQNTRLRADNTSGHRGVYLDRRRNSWSAEIHANGKKYFLGCFGTLEAAAAVYEEAAKELHGEFCRAKARVAA